MKYLEIIEDCYCNPWLVGMVIALDITMYFVREAIRVHTNIHQGDSGE